MPCSVDSDSRHCTEEPPQLAGDQFWLADIVGRHVADALKFDALRLRQLVLQCVERPWQIGIGIVAAQEQDRHADGAEALNLPGRGSDQLQIVVDGGH